MSDAPELVYAHRADLGTLVVTGDDRLGWLQGLITSDVAQLAPGTGRWGLFLTKPGKVLSEAIALDAGDAVYLGASASRLEALFDHLVGFLVMEDVDVAMASDVGWITVHGAGAEVIAEQARSAGLRAGRVDWRTVPGAAIAIAPPERERAVALLASAGAVPLADEAFQRHRIRTFQPAFGIDFDERHNPHDGSLERVLVSWEKGCYLGQEAVCMLDMRGKVKRRLVTLALAGAPPPPGTAVHGAGVEGPVGEVTSSVATPDGAHAFARIAASLAVAGQPLEVSGRAARVLEGPPEQ